MITGPTFEEMLHPQTIDPQIRAKALRMRTEDPLDPINLFNITWRDGNNEVYHVVLPPELTGVEAPIVVLYGKEFPSGSHKVGAAYSVLIEKQLFGESNVYYIFCNRFVLFAGSLLSDHRPCSGHERGFRQEEFHPDGRCCKDLKSRRCKAFKSNGCHLGLAGRSRHPN